MEGTVLVGRYKVGAQLGEGGGGTVHRARDRLLDRDIAIKIIHPEIRMPEWSERFRHEARAAARLDHPAIAAVYDLGQHLDQLFVVMPLLQGATLRTLIKAGPLEATIAIKIAIQIADALAHSHCRSVVHGDLKPDNVMVERQQCGAPRVRVFDFGPVPTSGDTPRAFTDPIFATPLYISPERLLSGDLDPKADIYALGLVLYESLAGRHPLSDGHGPLLQRAILDRPRSLRDRGLAIEESLDRLVMRCLAKEPSERPESALEVKTALVESSESSCGCRVR